LLGYRDFRGQQGSIQFVEENDMSPPVVEKGGKQGALIGIECPGQVKRSISIILDREGRCQDHSVPVPGKAGPQKHFAAVTHRADDLERRFDDKLNFEPVRPDKSAIQEKSALQLENCSSSFLRQDHGTLTLPRYRLTSVRACPPRGGLDADNSSLRSQAFLANNTPNNTAVIITEHRAMPVHICMGEAGILSLSLKLLSCVFGAKT